VSTLGKILVVLVLVFSVAFAMMAATGYATRADWQDKHRKEAEARKLATQAQATALKARDVALQAKREADLKLSKVTSQKDNEIRTLTADVATAQKNEKLARGQEEELRSLLKTAEENQTSKRKEADMLREEMNKARAERDASIKKQVSLQDTVAELNFKLDATQKRAEQLFKDLEERTAILKQFDLPTKIEDIHKERRIGQPDKPVKGLVKRVDEDGRYVLVTIGADDELKRGHQLIVFRLEPNAKFVGKLEVVLARPDEAVCKILHNYLQDVIRKGDHVQTATQ
jgi:hypothetical protein